MKVTMMVVVMVVLAVLFIAPVTWAEEPSEKKQEFETLLFSLDELEKGCPYSFSEEMFLSNVLKNMKEGFEAVISNPSLSKEEASLALTVKTRMEEVLNGPCCKTIRSLEKAQEIVFGLKKNLGVPLLPAKQWWEGLDDEDWRE